MCSAHLANRKWGCGRESVMDIIGEELNEMRRLCETSVPGSRLVTCARELVSVQIDCSSTCNLTVHMRFPDNSDHSTLPDTATASDHVTTNTITASDHSVSENVQLRYPYNCCVSLQLTSTTICNQFVSGLEHLCEKHVRDLLGSPQLLSVVRYVRAFVDKHPLCVCADEYRRIRDNLLTPSDKLSVRHKERSLCLKLHETEGDYRLSVRVYVPDEYPRACVTVQMCECSLLGALCRWLLAQANEVSRVCVEPPLLHSSGTAQRHIQETFREQGHTQTSIASTFKPSKSFYPVVQFLVSEFRRLVHEYCQQCNERAVAAHSSDYIEESGHRMHVERLYCGHLYHLGCLVELMRTPPFTHTKRCHACQAPIFHDKYKVPPRLEEARWAHKIARQRELDEVIDFLS